MIARATHPFEPAEADATTDWARPLLEEQVRMLGELAQMGMTLSRAIIRQATEPDAKPVVQGDVALAFDRVALAVRRTYALRAKLTAEIQAWEETAARRARKAERDRDYPDEAAEAWAREEMEHGPIGAPLALLMAAQDAGDPPPPPPPHPSFSRSSREPSPENAYAAIFDTA